MRMGGLEVFPSHRWFWGCLLFWFGLFSSCCWDGESGILDCDSMQCHVGVDGMSVGKHVSDSISVP